MLQALPATTHLKPGRVLRVLFGIALALVPFFFQTEPTSAVSGINEQINYQARLLTDTGAVVADGTYNIEFKIYQDGDGCESGGSAPCSGTLKWTETRTGVDRVTVKNGFLSVQLGSVTAFGSSVDWNQDTLWLSINIGGTGGTPTWDGEMTPFRRLSAVPYALNAGRLGGLDADSFLQIAPSAVQVDSGTLDSIYLNKTGASGNILRLQKSGTDIFVVDNSGNVALGAVAPVQKFEVQGGDAAIYNSGNNARLIIGDNGTSGQYGYLQWDSVNDYFRIEKNGTNGLKINDNYVSIGNIFPDSPLKVGNGSTLLMSVSTTGAFVSQNSTNSTNAFQVLNAAGNTIFNVDTTNGRVGIGGNFTPDQALDVVGNVQIRDADTETKGYRLRTTGGALDFEASGADLYFSTWSGAGFTGTQYNQITFKADGSSMDFQRGFNVASGFKVGLGGNVDPAETLDVNGLIQQTGRITSNTGAADNNKWTKLASCTMDVQFEGCISQLVIQGGLDGSAADDTRATASIRTRQQDALGNPPIVNVELDGVSSVIDDTDLVAVTTQNDATATVVELWGRITNTFEAWRFAPLLNHENKWTWFSTNGFQAALPAGTQTAASYGDLFTGALTATGGVQFLNSSSATIFKSDAAAETFVFGSDVTTGKHVGIDYSGNDAVLSIGSADGNAITISQFNASIAEIATDSDLRISRTAASTTAFELLDASDNVLFSMDTTNSRFRINGIGTNGGGSRVHFGDYGNVYIGETGTTDTDALTIHAEQGYTFEATAGTIATLSSTGAAVFKNTTDSSTAFRVQNAAGSTIIQVDTTSGNFTIRASATTYTERLCHDAANGATVGLTLGDCQATGQADFAEFYATDGTTEPGDIVMPTSGSNYEVTKTTKASQANSIGIISTNPTVDGIIGHNVTAASRQPVALAGRVPVKVSLENGPITEGDLLTSSSLPGTAKKAQPSDAIVGVALESYNDSSNPVSSLVQFEEEDRNKAHKGVLPSYTSDPSRWPNGTGKIMAFLKLSGGGAADQPKVNTQQAWSESSFRESSLISSTGEVKDITSTKIPVASQTKNQNDPHVLGVYKENTGDSTHAYQSQGIGELWVDNSGGDIAAGDALISSSLPGFAMKDTKQSPTSYVVATALENVVWSDVTDTTEGRKQKRILVRYGCYNSLNQAALQHGAWNGGLVSNDATFNGLVTFANTVKFSSHASFDDTTTFNGPVVVNGSTAGVIKLPKGQTSATVTYTTPHPRTPIVNITPTSFVNGSFRITNISPTVFTIELTEPQETDIEFHWTALDVAAPQGF